MPGFGSNQRPPYGSYGSSSSNLHGFYDVTETQSDTMVNSISKPSIRLNTIPSTKLELVRALFDNKNPKLSLIFLNWKVDEINSSKENNLNAFEEVSKKNRPIRTALLPNPDLDSKKLTISSNVSNEISMIDNVDHKSNVSVGNNNTINVSIIEENEIQPTSEISSTTVVDSFTEPTKIVETTVSSTKPNQFNGYIYYKNSRFNRANEIDITTGSSNGNYLYAVNYPTDRTETFRPSRLDDFRNKFESSIV